jgi:CheY-like chemotaxis protein
MRRGAHADTSHGARVADPPVLTLLIVEDEPSIAHALTRLFAREGYQVELAGNGQEALEACQRRAYTHILCDLWMPTLDGRGFYHALQRCQPQLCARVVFCTGDTLTPDLQTFLAHTGRPVLTKPFTAACVRRLLTVL